MIKGMGERIKTPTAGRRVRCFFSRHSAGIGQNQGGLDNAQPLKLDRGWSATWARSSPPLWPNLALARAVGGATGPCRHKTGQNGKTNRARAMTSVSTLIRAQPLVTEPSLTPFISASKAQQSEHTAPTGGWKGAHNPHNPPLKEPPPEPAQNLPYRTTATKRRAKARS